MVIGTEYAEVERFCEVAAGEIGRKTGPGLRKVG